jgi:hypothetical protein
LGKGASGTPTCLASGAPAASTGSVPPSLPDLSVDEEELQATKRAQPRRNDVERAITQWYANAGTGDP